jgi:hypothetical protein
VRYCGVSALSCQGKMGVLSAWRVKEIAHATAPGSPVSSPLERSLLSPAKPRFTIASSFILTLFRLKGRLSPV